MGSPFVNRIFSPTFVTPTALRVLLPYTMRDSVRSLHTVKSCRLLPSFTWQALNFKVFHIPMWRTTYSLGNLIPTYRRSSDDYLTTIIRPHSETISEMSVLKPVCLIYSFFFRSDLHIIPLCSMPHNTNMAQCIFAKFANVII